LTLRTKKALEVLNPELPEPGAKILIKPNLVEPKPKTSGAITRPEVVEGIIQFFNEKKYQIIVGEGTACPTTEKAFKIGGYQYLVQKYQIKLVDLNKGPFKKIKTGKKIWPEIEINKLALVSFFISAAVLKEHAVGVTLSIKNLMGTIAPKGSRGANKNYMHPEDDWHEPWAKRLGLLYKYLRPNLAVIDGTTGMYGSHISGRLEQKDLTIVGEDPLEVDKIAAEILGHQEVFYFKYLF